MSKSKQLVKKEEVLQAILIADNFSDQFQPLTNDTPFALLPLVNKPNIDYTLEFLALGGIEETFVFCCSHSEAIKEYIRKEQKNVIWANVMDVHILVSESCSSLGDCLRDIYAKGLIRGNFVLVEPGVVSNIKLVPLLQQYGEILKKDKGATMCLVMQETGVNQKGRCPSEDTMIVVGENNQVLWHRRMAGYDSNKVKLPLELFLHHTSVNILYNIRDTHIAICGPSVLSLFADNFDYQTRWDFIRGIMMVDEVDDSTIYSHILENGQMGACVTSWQMYDVLSWDIVAGWFYPISYKIRIPITFGRPIVKGNNCEIATSATLANCILGDNVKICENVALKNCHLHSNVTVGSSCVISDAIIGKDCVIKANSILSNGCILGDQVQLNEKTVLEDCLIQRKKHEDVESVQLSKFAHKLQPEKLSKILTNNFIYKPLVKDDYFNGFETSDSEDESYTNSPVPDDAKMFFTEVTDSLTRGFEDKLQCDNLILEINSSRYAYNVSLKEVNFFVFKAILSLPFQLQDGVQYLAALSRCLQYFSPILKNYIRDDESMKDCLQAIEDVAIANNELNVCIAKVLKWLYDKDFLSEEIIIAWFNRLDKELAIYSKVFPLVQWLQEAEEETSDED